MCVGALVSNEPSLQLLRKKATALKQLKFRQKLGRKEGGSEVRKEKSRDAARFRRRKESDYFQDLEELLPVSGTPPRSMSGIDKTSLIRLTVSHLKCRDIVANAGIRIPPEVKSELTANGALAAAAEEDDDGGGFSVVDALDGFSLVLSQEGDVIHVSNNVTTFIGLSAFELLGNPFSEFVHPCDHEKLRQLHPQDAQQDAHIEVFVRMKCTITERGRMINLKQASYKALKLSGKARRMQNRDNDLGGVQGVVFLGVGSLVCSPLDVAVMENTSWMFATKHAANMTFTEVDGWLVEEGNYSPNQLLGKSFFELVHTQDIQAVMPAFKNLKEHGQCETLPYRLLVGGGGAVWVQTKATIVHARRSSNKANSVVCKHAVITEIENKNEILSLIQTQARRKGSSSAAAAAAAATKRRSKGPRSTSASSCGDVHGRAVAAISTAAADRHHHNGLSKRHHQTTASVGGHVSAVVNGGGVYEASTSAAVSRFADMDILFDMWGGSVDQQTTSATGEEELLQATRLQKNSSSSSMSAATATTKVASQMNNGGSVSPQDSYSALLAMSPTNSGSEGEEEKAYIAETLAIHLGPMPSKSAVAREHHAAAAAAAAAAVSSPPHHVLQQLQRPTSVIVASASATTDFSGGETKSCRGGSRMRFAAAGEKAATDLAASRLSLAKPELYRALANSTPTAKKGNSLGGSGIITAPTANLFNRPKAVTDSLFFFNGSPAAAPATTTAIYAESTRATELPPPEPSSGRGVNFPISAKEFSMEEDTLLRELFGDMADNGTELEKLSPYMGDVCVILKEPPPPQSTGVGGGNAPGIPPAANPMDIQVIDFGAAGPGFDADIEIPLFGGGIIDDYKVKLEPGLDMAMDFKDFPPELLLAPLSPSQETPLYNNGGGGSCNDDMEGGIFGSRGGPMRAATATSGGEALAVKCERRSSPEAELIWTQLQPAGRIDPVRKSVISRNPAGSASLGRGPTDPIMATGGFMTTPHHPVSMLLPSPILHGDAFVNGDGHRSSVLRAAPIGGGGYDGGSSSPPTQPDYFYSMNSGDEQDFPEVLFTSGSGMPPEAATNRNKRRYKEEEDETYRDVKRYKMTQPPLLFGISSVDV